MPPYTAQLAVGLAILLSLIWVGRMLEMSRRISMLVAVALVTLGAALIIHTRSDWTFVAGCIAILAGVLTWDTKPPT